MDFNEKIGHIRLQEIATAAPGDSLESVLDLMRKTGVGCAVILENTKAVGVFTERDYLLRAIDAQEPASVKIEEFMTRNPFTLNKSATIQKAITLMAAKGLRHVPIVEDNGEPVKLLSVRNLIDYLVECFPAEVINLPPTLDQKHLAPEGA